MKKLSALFVPTGNSGISYWRFWNFYNSMWRQGIANAPVIWWTKDQYETASWERQLHEGYGDAFRITNELWSWAQQADIVVFGMLHGPGWKQIQEGFDPNEDYFSKSLAMFHGLRDSFEKIGLSTPILSEIDDDMLSTPPYNPASGFYAPQEILREVALEQFRKSDGLIVSTPTLGELYSDFNQNVHVIPNAIDFNLWGKLQRKPKKGIRIGWAGGANHEEDLRIMEKVIPIITEKHKDVRFVFLHGCPHYLRGLKNVEYVADWCSIDKYPKMLASLDFDIGIAPLVDNAFNRGKSNLRWLEYSALGIPTVASKVGHFKETIKDGFDGLLAEDVRDFVSDLEVLISDKKKRKEIGKEALKSVYRDFNVDTVSKEYVKVLQSEIEKKEKVPEVA